MSVSPGPAGITTQPNNLVSVLYHALQGAETCDLYIQDAERSGDVELAAFFREVQQEERQRAEKAKALLGQRLGQGTAP